jgi:hypothetical protein
MDSQTTLRIRLFTEREEYRELLEVSAVSDESGLEYSFRFKREEDDAAPTQMMLVLEPDAARSLGRWLLFSLSEMAPGGKDAPPALTPRS